MKHFTKTFTLCFLLTITLLLTLTAAEAQTKPVKKATPTPTKKPVPIKVIKTAPPPDTKNSTQPVISGVVNGKATSLPKPVYPEEARKLRIAGTVGVRVLIDERGNVISAKAETGVDNLPLRTASEKAAMQAKFSPTTLNGEPVKVSGIINYNFVVGEEPKRYFEETKFLNLGMFLSVMQNAAANEAAFNEFFDFKDFKTEFAEEFGVFSEPITKDIETLAALPELSGKQRAEAIDKAVLAIEPKLNEAELWQFRLGKDFGDLFNIFSKAIVKDVFDTEKFDLSAVKLTALNLKDSIKSAPPEFSATFLRKIKEIVTALEKLDSKQPEMYAAVFGKLSELLEILSPQPVK